MAEWLGLSLTWFYYGREIFLSKQEACPKEGIACSLQQHARAWPCQLCMCGRKSSHTDVWQQLPMWALEQKRSRKGQFVWDSAGKCEARGSACKCSAHKSVMSVFNIISVLAAELQQWNQLTVASQNSQDSNGTPLLAAVGRNVEHLAVSGDQLSQHWLLPLKPSLLSWTPVSRWDPGQQVILSSSQWGRKANSWSARCCTKKNTFLIASSEHSSTLLSSFLPLITHNPLSKKDYRLHQKRYKLMLHQNVKFKFYG